MVGIIVVVATYHVQNFGCRATQADGAAIERQLLERGLLRAEGASQAEVVVLNTCTVTASADQDARAAIRRIHRENPGAQILVTGCYAQRAPEELSAIPGVSLVIGNSHKHRLADYVGPFAEKSARPTHPQSWVGCPTHPRVSDEWEIVISPETPGNNFVPLAQLGAPTGSKVIVGDIFAHTELTAAPVFDGDSLEKTRPNLKVQDGCNNRCSFCIIPYVRGRSRSLKLDEVLCEVEALVANGYREIVLSGINLGRWGRELQPQMRFADMLRAILERTAIEKLRISSVEPMDWANELIELVASSPRICKHAHVPLQSGSDRILRKMHRKYRPWHYADRIERIRRAMPDAAIGADVMVGFPGETRRRLRRDARADRTPAIHVSARLHVFVATGHAVSGDAGSSAGANRARTQSHPPRVGVAEEARVHGIVRRARSGSHHVDALRRRVHRSADGQLPEVARARGARGKSLVPKQRSCGCRRRSDRRCTRFVVALATVGFGDPMLYFSQTSS